MKKKLTVVIAAVIFCVTAAVQYYTNRKIDQTLQQFPYHLKDQVSLNVIETEKNFFRRQLTFFIEDGQNKKEIITAKLTALPFAVLAESQLSENLIRELNRSLNITIGKNQIKSQRFTVGDTLQTTISAEFRDATNTAQTLDIDIDLSQKNKNISIQSKLNGLNYEDNIRLKGLNGEYQFVPINESLYDITAVNLSVQQADIALLNGENTQIQLENARYTFDKGLNPENKDLHHHFNGQSVRIFNKNRTEKENQTVIKKIDIKTKQNQVLYSVNFYEKFGMLKRGDANIHHLVDLLVSMLTENQHFNAKITLDSLDVPKNKQRYFYLTGGELEWDLNNQQAENAILSVTLNAENIQQIKPDNQENWQVQDLKMNLGQRGIHIQNQLALFNLAIFQPNDKTENDEKTFLSAVEKYRQAFNEQTQINAEFSRFNYDSDLEAENGKLSLISGVERKEKTAWKTEITAEVDHFQTKTNHVQFNRVKLKLPYQYQNFNKLSTQSFCLLEPKLAFLCQPYFTSATQRQQEEPWIKHADISLSVNELALSFGIDTLPASQNNDVHFNGAFYFPPLNIKQLNLIDKWRKVTGHFNLDFPQSLIFEKNENAEKIKAESDFWQLIINLPRITETQINPIFLPQGGRYHLNWEKNDKGILFNGKTEQEIRDKIQHLLLEKTETPSLN